MKTRMTLDRRSLLGGAGALAIAARSGTARADAPRFPATRNVAAAAAAKRLGAGGVPSLCYALAGPAGVIWAEAAGVIDKATLARPTADTLYGIGSCSKVFAVAAMMKLVERGLVSLDDPLVKHVPSFRMLSEEYTAITIRMLMNHSSGLPGSEYRNGMTTGWRPGYLDQVIATAAGSRLAHRPGELAVYCNDGFTMLEAVILAVTGRPFADFLEDEILAPLGMLKSRYGNRPALPGSYAPGFVGGRRLPREIANSLASGGLQTTAAEWGRCLAMFLNEGRLGGVSVLKTSSVNAMAENQTARLPFNPLPPVDGYGLGWDSVNSAPFAALGLRAWRKNGGTAVYSSDMIVLPEAGLAVAVSCAAAGADAGAISEEIIFAALVEQGTIPAMPQPLTADASPPAGKPLDAAWFEGVFGTYVQTFRFEPDGQGGATQMRASGGSWSKHYEGLSLRSDGSVATPSLPGIRFGLLDYEGITYLKGSGPSGFRTVAVEALAAQKLAPRPAFAEAWKKRMGKSWVFVNAGADMFFPGMQKLVLRLDGLPGAPGYVIVSMGLGGDDINQPVDASGDAMRALMCLKAPGGPSRDLNDLVVIARDGEEWLQYGSWVARPLDSVPVLGSGTLELTVGPEGHAAWVKLGAAAWIDITGAADWQLWSAEQNLIVAGKGDVTGISGTDVAFALLYGGPGDKLVIRVD